MPSFTRIVFIYLVIINLPMKMQRTLPWNMTFSVKKRSR